MNYARACMSLSKGITIGTPEKFTLEGKPDTYFTPEILLHNSHWPFFVYVGNLKIAGQHLLISGGLSDLYNLTIDFPKMPEITPAMSIEMNMVYSGYIPPSFRVGEVVCVSVTFKGMGRWE